MKDLRNYQNCSYDPLGFKMWDLFQSKTGNIFLGAHYMLKANPIQDKNNFSSIPVKVTERYSVIISLTKVFSANILYLCTNG